MSTETTYYGILFSRQVSIFSIALGQACCIMSPQYLFTTPPSPPPVPAANGISPSSIILPVLIE